MDERSFLEQFFFDKRNWLEDSVFPLKGYTMRNWNNGNNWDFGRWLRNVSRNSKANISVNSIPADELALYRTVVNFFCNIEEEIESDSSSEPGTPTGKYQVGGTRPWLYQRLLDKATSASNGYRFDASVEPGYVIVRALEVIARDLIAIPLSAEETEYLESLDFMPVDGTDHPEGGTMHRAFGSQPGFGGVSGARVEYGGVESSSSGEPSVARETTFHFENSTDETYLIEGVLDCNKMIELGFYYQSPYLGGTWIKHPTSVDIGSGVTTVGIETFYNCGTLNSVEIPNSVTVIEAYVFGYCAALQSLVIPDSVTKIWTYAFVGCGIESVTIGNSVEEIGTSAFVNCYNLTTITIPASVQTIGHGAFLDTPLTELIMEGKTTDEVQSMEEYAWGAPTGIPIKCSDGDLEAPEYHGT